MLDLREPFRFDVVEGGRADDGEADQEDVGLGIGEGSESVIIFLPRGVPESEADGFAVDHHTCGVVVEAARAGVKDALV